MSYDPYAVAEDLEEMATKDTQKKRGGGRFVFLSPGKEEKSRETTVRPAFNPDPDQNHGQRRPIERYVCHEGLDQDFPGSTKKVYPGLKSGFKTSVCLNNVAIQVGDKFLPPEDDDYCRICPTLGPLYDKKRDIEDEAKSTDSAKLKKLERTFGIFLSKLKATVYYIFVGFHRLGSFDDTDEAKEAGKVGLDAKGKIVSDLSSAKWTTDPLALFRVKAWWWTNFKERITEPSMTKGKFIKTMNDGKVCSDEEYKRRCPKARKSPFDPEKGWEMEIEVSGKGFDQKWEVRAEDPEKLSKLDVQLLKINYPNVTCYTRPYGYDELPSWDQWKKENPDGDENGYRHSCLLFLQSKQDEILFANAPKGNGNKVKKADDDEVSEESFDDDGEDEELEAFNLDEPQTSSTSGEIEDDIPF